VIRVLTRLTETAAEDQLLAGFLDYARITNAASIPDATARLRSAIARFQSMTGRALLTQTYRLTLDQWPVSGSIELGRAPVSAVSSITYLDTADDTQTVTASHYALLQGEDTPGQVYLRDAFDWPSLSDSPAAVIVAYTAGHTSADLLPAHWVTAIYAIAAGEDSIRTPGISGTIYTQVTGGAADLIAQCRIGGFIG
jgi:uncharacterized phiE125 gp8 family phage protein